MIKDSSAIARCAAFFGLLTNIIATVISFFSVTDVLDHPDFGALATELVASNLFLALTRKPLSMFFT